MNPDEKTPFSEIPRRDLNRLIPDLPQGRLSSPKSREWLPATCRGIYDYQLLREASAKPQTARAITLRKASREEQERFSMMLWGFRATGAASLELWTSPDPDLWGFYVRSEQAKLANYNGSPSSLTLYYLTVSACVSPEVVMASPPLWVESCLPALESEPSSPMSMDQWANIHLNRLHHIPLGAYPSEPLPPAEKAWRVAVGFYEVAGGRMIGNYPDFYPQSQDETSMEWSFVYALGTHAVRVKNPKHGPESLIRRITKCAQERMHGPSSAQEPDPPQVGYLKQFFP